MSAYYNEIDPFAAQWLRNLIAAGHIAPGIVDERPIQEIEPWELIGFTQCHFFAGIGVWSHALRRAGWPDDRPIWTGSCPCQPFSNAGKKKGFSDERHLWPYWQNLIAERKPAIVVGEQVASALEWIDLVSTDMERAGYAFGAADLCAAGFDGAHIRQRNYFVGISNTETPRWRLGNPENIGSSSREIHTPANTGATGGLANDNDTRHTTLQRAGIKRNHGYRKNSRAFNGLECRKSDYGLADDDDTRSQGRGLRRNGSDQRAARETGLAGGLADDDDEQNRSGRRILRSGKSPSESGGTTCERLTGFCEDHVADAPMLGRTPVDWLYCRDGKWRPVEPGTFPLVDETPSRVGRLRAYGNALDAETATQFCKAVKEICDEFTV